MSGQLGFSTDDFGRSGPHTGGNFQGLDGLSEEERKKITDGVQEAVTKILLDQDAENRKNGHGTLLRTDGEVPLPVSRDVDGPIAGLLAGARRVYDEIVGSAEDRDRERALITLRNKLKLEPIGQIVTKSPDGLTRVWAITGEDIEWWELAGQHWPPNEKGEMHIPYPFLRTRVEKPRFAACTFDATKDFLRAMWGRDLDVSDKDWLALHPHATDGGMPQEYVLTALQELVQPYNLAIDRVRIKSGAFFMGDALEQWVLALGCNPFALADHTTTNAEAAARLGIPVAEANKMWRFEFGPEPLRPSVLGERGFPKGTSNIQSSYGGHARFLAPRSGFGDWWYSLQYAPIERVEEYAAPITFPEYVPRGDVEVLVLQDVQGPDKMDIADRVWNNRQDERRWKPYFMRTRGGGGYIGGATGPVRNPTHTAKSPNGGTASDGAEVGRERSPKGRVTVYHADGTVRDETGTLLVGVGHDVPYGRLLDEIRKKEGKRAKQYHYADLWQSVSHIFRPQPAADYFCLLCRQSHNPHTERLDVALVCEMSYRAIWSNYECPDKGCQHKFDQRHAPVCLGREVGTSKVRYQCPRLRCKTEFMVFPSDMDKELVRLSVLVAKVYVRGRSDQPKTH